MNNPTAGDVYQPLMDAVGEYAVRYRRDQVVDIRRTKEAAAVRREAERLVLRAQATWVREFIGVERASPTTNSPGLLSFLRAELHDLEARLAALEVKE